MSLGKFTQLFSKFLGKFKTFLGDTATQTVSYSIGTASSVVLEPLFRALSHETEERIQNQLIEISSLLEAYQRGLVSGDFLRVELHKMGLNDYRINVMVDAHRRILDVGGIQDLYNRGELGEGEARERLSRLGYTEKEQGEIIKLAGAIPSVSDFVRFAVREVFSPEIAEKYGQFQDYPREFDSYARKAGLDPQYAKFYWAAHWELPSLGEGFDMFHRGLINHDELSTLMRSLDIMPYWRDKLIKLSETPFTRVDVRRMYQLGVLTLEEMVRAYMDLGYSREKAEKMSEFTVKDVTDGEMDLTRTEVTALYHDGAISRDEAHSFLLELGFSEERAAYALLIEDMKLQREKLNAVKSTIKRAYVRLEFDRNDVLVEFGRLGIPASEVEALIPLWDIERNERLSLPTKAEFTAWFKAGLIDEDTFRAELARLGYADYYVELYTSDALAKKAKVTPTKPTVT